MMITTGPATCANWKIVVERAVVLSTQSVYDRTCSRKAFAARKSCAACAAASEFLPPLPGEPGSRLPADNPQPSLFQIMDEIERRIIIDMLERTG